MALRHRPVASAARLVPLVAAAILAAGCGGSNAGADASDASAEGTVGEAPGADTGADRPARIPGEKLAIPLPDVRVRTTAGDTVSLRRSPDEVTVINFWATWCLPCLKEIPELLALEDSIRGRGGRVLGITVSSGSAADVRDFAAEHGMDYDLAMVKHGWAREHFDVFGLPVTLVVDRSGKIRRRLVGPHDLEQFLTAVRPHLRHGATGAPGPVDATEEARGAATRRR